VIEEKLEAIIESLHGTRTGKDLFLSVGNALKEMELPWQR